MISTAPIIIFGLSARSSANALALEVALGTAATLGVVAAGNGRRCLLGAIGRIG